MIHLVFLGCSMCLLLRGGATSWKLVLRVLSVLRMLHVLPILRRVVLRHMEGASHVALNPDWLSLRHLMLLAILHLSIMVYGATREGSSAWSGGHMGLLLRMRTHISIIIAGSTSGPHALGGLPMHHMLITVWLSLISSHILPLIIRGSHRRLLSWTHVRSIHWRCPHEVGCSSGRAIASIWLSRLWWTMSLSLIWCHICSQMLIANVSIATHLVVTLVYIGCLSPWIWIIIVRVGGIGKQVPLSLMPLILVILIHLSL